MPNFFETGIVQTRPEDAHTFKNVKAHPLKQETYYWEEKGNGDAPLKRNMLLFWCGMYKYAMESQHFALFLRFFAVPVNVTPRFITH